MVVFHSYVSLPEGILLESTMDLFDQNGHHDLINQWPNWPMWLPIPATISGGKCKPDQWGFETWQLPKYPLVMTNIANWKDPPFLMGKSTISMAIFNSYVTNYQRVILGWLWKLWIGCELEPDKRDMMDMAFAFKEWKICRRAPAQMSQALVLSFIIMYRPIIDFVCCYPSKLTKCTEIGNHPIIF
jgi:hypothetical protein